MVRKLFKRLSKIDGLGRSAWRMLEAPLTGSIPLGVPRDLWLWCSGSTKGIGFSLNKISEVTGCPGTPFSPKSACSKLLA